MAIALVAGCRVAPEPGTPADSAAAPLMVPPAAGLAPSDTLDRLIAELERKLAPIADWRATAITQLRADSATTRADSIAFAQRTALGSLVRELTQSFNEPAFQQLVWPSERPPAERAVADSLNSFLRARGIWAHQAEGDSYFPVSEAAVLAWIGPYVTPGYRDFLEFHALNQERPFAADASLMIEIDELTARIVRAETLLRAYPESPARDQLRRYFHQFLAAYIGGIDNTPAFTWNDGELRPGLRESMQEFVAEHGKTDAGAVVRGYLRLLARSNYKRSAPIDAVIKRQWEQLHSIPNQMQ